MNKRTDWCPTALHTSSAPMLPTLLPLSFLFSPCSTLYHKLIGKISLILVCRVRWSVDFRNRRDLLQELFFYLLPETLAGDDSRSLIKDGYVINTSVKSLHCELVIWAGLTFHSFLCLFIVQLLIVSMETELAMCCCAAFGPSAISPSFTFLPVFLDIEKLKDSDTMIC